MTDTTLTASLTKAIENLALGQPVSGLSLLLDAALKTITTKEIDRQLKQVETVRDQWRLHQGFSKQIEQIGRTMVEAMEPRANCIYIVDWSVISLQETPERLRVEMRYDIDEEDWLEGEIFTDITEREGGTHATKKVEVEVNSEWLGQPSSVYMPLVEIIGLKRELWMAEYHQKSRIEDVPKLRKRYEETRDKVATEVTRIAELKAQIETAEANLEKSVDRP